MTPGRRTGRLLALVAAVGLLGVVALLGLAIGIDGPGSSPNGDPPAPSPVTTVDSPTRVEMVGDQGGRGDQGDRDDEGGEATIGLGPDVHLVEGSGAHSTILGPVVGELPPSSVLRVTAAGFEPFAVGQARQCVATRGRRCGNAIGVQFGEDGVARFQYLVSPSFAPAGRDGGCRSRGAPCWLEVTSEDGGRAEIATVFVDPVPEVRPVSVSPAVGLVDGDAVEVDVTGLPASVAVDAVLCAVATPDDPPSCTPPLDATTARSGPDGTLVTTVTIPAGAVGPDGPRCDRAHRCLLTVTSSDAVVRAQPARLRFAASTGADYDPVRVLGGGVGAALLLLGAAWLIRRSDWAPVGEEAAPEIDDAEYADLDAIVAALPPEEPSEALASPH